ncbi:hypothetical protein CKY51_17575 [Xanthomonas maliensis]|nr:hypothetical protein CKY51_17575 [Xanthomonas maliensis]
MIRLLWAARLQRGRFGLGEWAVGIVDAIRLNSMDVDVKYDLEVLADRFLLQWPEAHVRMPCAGRRQCFVL